MGATLLSPEKILREKSAPAPHALRVDRLEPYFITLVSWGRGVPHVSVTYTPLATISIFNKFLNLKIKNPPLEGACRRFITSSK